MFPRIGSKHVEEYKIYNDIVNNMGRDSIDGMATRYGLDGPGIEYLYKRDFWHPPRLSLRPTQSLVKWVPALFPGGKDAGSCF